MSTVTSSFPNNYPEKKNKKKQTTKQKQIKLDDFTTETVIPYKTDKEYLFR